MRVFLTLRDKRTGKTLYREFNPLAEEFKRNPKATINEWIEERGNAQSNTELELVSFLTE